MTVLYNAPAPNVPFFTPAQYPASGTATRVQHDGKDVPTLFQPLKIRGVTFQNRIWLSPLCQYSAKDGFVQPWHIAHLGGIISRGPGFSFVEATAVTPEGRITPEDVGIWNDEQADAWKPIVDFAHSQNQKIGIQLAHAGRKASAYAPWLHFGAVVPASLGGWPEDVVAPSAIPFDGGHAVPKELTKEGIQRIVGAYVAAARRSLRAGFDVIEIHAAHGYLLSEFLSPTANKRTDNYGGSFENRIRILIEIVDAVRAVIPPEMPLFVRVSATEWLEEVLPNEPSWRVEDTVALAGVLADHGVDLLDVSSGGVNSQQKIKGGPTFQAPFAEAVKKAHGDKILVTAVGSIADGQTAQSILDKNQADAIFVGRHFQKNPGAVWQFADDLNVSIENAHQIQWGFGGRGQKPKTVRYSLWD